MKSAVVILALLGCDCDGVACEHIRTVSSDWASVESCEASRDFRSAATGSASYPLVIARCSVDGDDAGSVEVAGHDRPDAATDGQADAPDAAGSRAEPGWAEAGSSVRGFLVAGAAGSVRTIGSSLKIYAVEPVRSMSSRMLAGLWD